MSEVHKYMGSLFERSFLTSVECQSSIELSVSPDQVITFIEERYIKAAELVLQYTVILKNWVGNQFFHFKCFLSTLLGDCVSSGLSVSALGLYTCIKSS